MYSLTQTELIPFPSKIVLGVCLELGLIKNENAQILKHFLLSEQRQNIIELFLALPKGEISP